MAAHSAPLRWLTRQAPLRGRPEPAAQRLVLSQPPQTQLLVLQPTPFCNIDCSYCYLPERSATHRMSLHTVRQAALRLREDGLDGPDLTVVWHAGEPLVMPVSFYEDAFGTIESVLGRPVLHSLQTNATLIDDDWCRFFLRRGVRVGVSVDGPAALHDRHRRTRQGQGTHAQVLRGLALLRAHAVPCHAIAVVTRETLADADTFFDFFAEQGITDVGCNFDEAEGGHAASSLAGAGAEADHAAFLQRLLQRSLQSDGRVVVRELAAAYRLVAEPLPHYHFAGQHWPRNAQVMPFALLSVAWNGDFSTFSPELLGQRSAPYADFVLGNVHRDSYLQQADTPAFQRLWRAVAEGVQACSRSCAYFSYCGGGAPANKLYENGSFASAETLYCRSMVQRPFDVVLHSLEQGLAANSYGAPAP